MKTQQLQLNLGLKCIYDFICDLVEHNSNHQVTGILKRLMDCTDYSREKLFEVSKEYSNDTTESILNIELKISNDDRRSAEV